MAAELFTPPSRALDSNANPLAGARWFFYATGTTTPQTVYADSGLATPLANPVTADSGGKFAPIYFDPSKVYRGVLKTADGATTLYDIDPVNSSFGGTTGAGSVGFDSTVTYPASTVGKALADLYSQASATVSANPILDGALIGPSPDGNSTKTYQYRRYNLTGSRTNAQIGECIVIYDDQNGPLSGPSTPTPDSASYALSLVNVRPNWNTTTKTGEVDGLNIFLRQGGSDAAGILSNIGATNGFACTGESYTFDADAAGAPVKAVNLQWGVANGRDGLFFGYLAQAATGTGLTAAFSARETGTATWANAYEYINAAGTTLWYVRGSDGAIVGGSVQPRVDAGADLGSNSFRFNAAYVRQVRFSPFTVSQLPSAASNAGLRAFVSDATATTFASIVAGGGANNVPVYSDGTNWRIG